MLYHVVALKLKKNISTEETEHLFTGLHEVEKIFDPKVICHFGENNSQEKLNHGFTHSYIAIFNNTVARDAYVKSIELNNYVTKRVVPFLDGDRDASVSVLDFSQ